MHIPIYRDEIDTFLEVLQEAGYNVIEYNVTDDMSDPSFVKLNFLNKDQITLILLFMFHAGKRVMIKKYYK